MPADDRNKPKDTPSPKVRLDDFVANAVPDPGKVGETLFITGFLGASSQPEYTRIYSDASLSSYVDVRTSDIVHSEALSKEQSALGGSYVWVKREAEVYYGAPGQSTKGKFLQGPLTAAYGGQFGAAEGAIAGAIKPFPTLECTWNPPQCPPTAHLFCFQTNYPCYAEAAAGGAGQFAAPAAGGANPAAIVGTAVCTHFWCTSVHCSYFCPHSYICAPIYKRAGVAGPAATAAPAYAFNTGHYYCNPYYSHPSACPVCPQ